jgi:choice-of-anchor A domain-containing protein
MTLACALAAHGMAGAATPNSSDPSNPFNYNVFTIGDDTQSNVDDQGKVAVGGNLTSSGLAIGTQLGGSKTTNLVVGGNYTNQYNSLNGNAAIGGNSSWNGATINGGLSAGGSVNFSGWGQVTGAVTYGTTYSNPTTTIQGGVSKGATTLPIDFSSAATYLNNTSSAYSKIAANGTTMNSYGSITLNAGSKASALDVFTLSGSQLSGANGLTINADPNATVLINIDGSADQMQNFNININGTDKQHVLYNFYQASSLTLSGVSVKGTILAPGAATNFSNGNIDGSLLVNSVAGGGEGHNFLFQGNIDPTPEASTALSLMLLACGGLFLAARGKSRKAILSA